MLYKVQELWLTGNSFNGTAAAQYTVPTHRMPGCRGSAVEGEVTQGTESEK